MTTSPAVRTYETDDRYWNMIGPFGGWIAAALLRPVLDHPDRHGDPISVTINFAAAIRAGAYDVRVELLRRNRSSSFWFVRFEQDHDGERVHCADATVVLAVRRGTPAFAIATAPVAPPPERIDPLPARAKRAKWMDAFDIRFASGEPFARDANADDPRAIAWVRDRLAGPLGFASLLALSDCAFPQIFHRVARFIPISTISMTVYFHATADDLAAVGDDFVLYEATMRAAYEGFFDETSVLFARDGKLLATMEQIVWYKVPEPEAPATR